MSTLLYSHDIRTVDRQKGRYSNSTSSDGGKSTSLSYSKHRNGRVSPKGQPLNNNGGDINRKTVLRIDTGVNQIIRTISCVVVYEYMEEADTWVRTSMEGTLFIYSRDTSVSPHTSHAFLILSKLTNENHLVHLYKELMLHTKEPFVLFRQSTNNKVYGMNFTDDETCARVGDELHRLCQASGTISPSNQASLLTVSDRGTYHLTPSPSLSDNSLDGDSPDEVGSHHRESRDRKHENGRRQKQGTNRRTSEPVVIVNHKNRKRDVSPHSRVASKFPSNRTNQKTGSHASSITPKLSAGISGNLRGTKGSLTDIKQYSKSFDYGQYGGQSPPVMSASPPVPVNPVKKLFSSNSEDVPDATPTVLTSLFASASTQTVATPTTQATPTSNAYSTPPKKMVSVTELERQMGTVTPPSSSEVIPIVTSSQLLLLQPSAFSNSNHKMVENIPSNGQSPRENRTNMTTPENQLEVNVLPPTPVTVGASPILIGRSFPSIPSLVQSPGMRSQPVTSSIEHSTNSTMSTSICQSTAMIQSSSTNHIADVTMTSTSSTLMSPQVFTSVNRSCSEPTKNTQIGLNKQQLQQALLHLIKNDANFMDTIHEAYAESLKSSNNNR